MKTSPDNLKSLMQCSVCHHKYEPVKALLLEERGDQTTFHVTCASCGVSTVVLVSASQFGLMSMGLLTDLEGEEVRNLFGGAAVSSSEVLDAHLFLKEFSGSAEEFLRVGLI